MSVTPDIAGFIAADQRRRQQTGTSITFEIPQAPTWPAGTTINPDTNEPYSAMAERTNPPFVTVAVTANVILKEASPLRPQADTHFAEAGLMSGMDIILDIDAVDYPTVQDATEFVYSGKTYRVEEWKPFEIANTPYRWLVYGMEH